MTSPSEFTTFEFPISDYFNFQIFVRSRRDPKEKLPGRVPTPVVIEKVGRFITVETVWQTLTVFKKSKHIFTILKIAS